MAAYYEQKLHNTTASGDVVQLLLTNDVIVCRLGYIVQPRRLANNDPVRIAPENQTRSTHRPDRGRLGEWEGTRVMENLQAREPVLSFAPADTERTSCDGDRG